MYCHDKRHGENCIPPRAHIGPRRAIYTAKVDTFLHFCNSYCKNFNECRFATFLLLCVRLNCRGGLSEGSVRGFVLPVVIPTFG